MGVRAEFEVYKLPEKHISREVHYAFEQDGETKDKFGNLRKKMVQKIVETHGGYLIVVRGKPGHSIRVTSLDQAIALKLLPPEAKEIKPRLINTETGEECDEHGIPLSVVKVMGEMHGAQDGHVETDVDVERADHTLELDRDKPDESAVGNAISKLE